MLSIPNALPTLLGFLIFFQVLTVAPTCNAEAPVVDLGYAKYLGLQNSSTNIFHGVRYAAPPTGSLRWQPPVPIESQNNYTSSSVINATAYGPQCFQGNQTFSLNSASSLLLPEWSRAGEDLLLQSSEDCLVLDIFLPVQPKSDALPVVVNFHGGGYTGGNNLITDGTPFVNRSDGNVIWISAQYRLGVYGFLSGPEIRNGSGTANAGLLDQRAALEWVQRHATALGGDPAKITIWGGSAGGGSVVDQLIMYGGVENPPFRAAIAEFPGHLPFHNDTVLDEQYNDLLVLSNCSNINCLRGLSEGDFAEVAFSAYGYAYERGQYGYSDFFYSPSVDGNIIRDLPSSELAAGHFSKVPVLVDREGYEGIVFPNLNVSTPAEADAALQAIWQAASPSFFSRLSEVLPFSEFSANSTFFSDPFFSSYVYSTLVNVTSGAFSTSNAALWRLQAVIGSGFIDCPTYFLASAFANASIPSWKLLSKAYTELHSSTQIFLVNPSSYYSANVTLADIYKDYFLSFAVDLDPNTLASPVGIARPQWPSYGAEQGNTQVLQIDNSTIQVVGDVDAGAVCGFYASETDVLRS